MFFMKKSNVMFRDYKSFGYITDNRNFGYKKSDDNNDDIGDKIVSESAAIFLSALDKKPIDIDEIVNKIKIKYTDIDYKIIKKDACDFYCIVENEGFIVSGKTKKECREKDWKFSYKKYEPKVVNNDNSSEINNVTKSTQEFLKDYFNDEPQLISIHLEITSKCNERCIHCYIPHENKINNIKTDFVYNILKQCRDMNLLHVTLSGGEPLLHENICDIIIKCKEYDFSLNLLSNLTLLNDQIIAVMKKYPLLCVQVSLYSMNSKIHDSITQVNGSYEKTIKSIMKLIENDIPLQISCPILKQNKDCYKDVENWAKKHNIHVGSDYLIIGRYNNTIQNLDSRLSISEVKEIINDLIVNDPEYIKKIESESENKKNISENDFICSVCSSSICISETGYVYPCAGWQEYVVGDANNTSIKEIWNNSNKIKYLRNLRRINFTQCIECSDKEYCTMCMVRNANENPKGDPLLVSEFYCNVVKLNKEMTIEWKKIIN